MSSYGVIMILLAAWGLVSRREVRSDYDTDTLVIRFGLPGVRRDVELSINDLEVILSRVNIRFQGESVVVLLTRRQNGDETVRLAYSDSRSDLLPLFQELRGLLKGQSRDETAGSA